MIRRLNYTGRRKIQRSSVTVRLVRLRDDDYAFTVEADLAGYRFPPQASVYVEAYNAVAYQRYEFGTVADIRQPADTRLDQLTATGLPKFRLKIVDRSEHHGRLLGVADKLIPLRPEEDEARKQSLLAVDFRDLGERVWRLDLDDWPVLELNNRIEDIGEIARSGYTFLGLVYPEVVRRILHEIIVEQELTDPEFDDSEWQTLWLRYACRLPGVEAPPEGNSDEARQAKADWIERAVAVFCVEKQARWRFQMDIPQGVA